MEIFSIWMCGFMLSIGLLGFIRYINNILGLLLVSAFWFITWPAMLIQELDKK
jgi:hypothetical protein